MPQNTKFFRVTPRIENAHIGTYRSGRPWNAICVCDREPTSRSGSFRRMLAERRCQLPAMAIPMEEDNADAAKR